MSRLSKEMMSRIPKGEIIRVYLVHVGMERLSQLCMSRLLGMFRLPQIGKRKSALDSVQR
jgi:hypothetical protein